MQVRDEPESKIHFDEPITALLNQKGRVWSIPPEATVYEAIERMSEINIGALVVITAEKLVGIVSERDYARKVILKGRQSREIRVREIMSMPVFYVAPETTIDECMRVMASGLMRHLPVLEDERVVGMISMGDLVKWIISSHEQTIHQMENYIGGTYPG
jgi:signal-transduction protein with cAMP-binding, CBS, and nucleotidyltransferase domain